MRKHLVCLLFVMFILNVDCSSNINWPFFIYKCNRSSPEFNTCMKDYANFALPFIFPGQALYGILPVVPFTFEGLPGLNLGNNTFKLHIDYPRLYGLNHFYVAEMRWNFEGRKIFIHFKYQNALRLMGTFNSSGTFLNRPFAGEGYCNLIFLNGDLTFNTTYRELTIKNKTYIQIFNSQVTAQEDLRVLFENTAYGVEEQLDENAFLNENSQQFHADIFPQWKINVRDIIDGTLEPIFFNFDLNTIFI